MSLMSNKKKSYVIFVIIIIAFKSLLAETASDKIDISSFRTSDNHFMQGLPNTTENSTPIDNSIDPSHYYIGGGDIFSISVIGLPSIKYTAPVDNNGNIFLSDLGLIQLNKETLTQATSSIATFVQTKLKKNNQVYVVLKRAKTVTISVTGAVSNPGTYQVTGFFRILDAIKLANNNSLPSLSDCNYREVLVTNRDSTATCDIFEFLFANDLNANPYVYPGDNIKINLTTRRVLLVGAIRSKVGSFVPIKQNETLQHFLPLFPLDESADSTHVLVTQTNLENGNSIRTVDRLEYSSFMLQDPDVITVPRKPDYRESYVINLEGEVSRPGVYPIVKGHTFAEDVINQAGGITKDGNGDNAFIIRQSKIVGDVGTGPVLDMSVRPEINSALDRSRLMNDYAFISLHKQGLRTLLQNGDNIVIPKYDGFIYISGNVKKPGAYNFVAGKNYHYYIGQAGGFTDKGDHVNVFAMTRYNKYSQIKDPNDLAEGDILVVPDQSEAKRLTTIIIPTISVLATAVLALIAIYQVSR